MVERAKGGKNLTYIHGDAHARNFLLPRDPNNGRAYLIDRQPFDWSLQCWAGVSDLAYLMVHWWYPERRRLLERPLLERYHRRLQEHGIKDYDWDDLWYDYRLSAIFSLLVVAAWGGETELAFNWYPQLEKATAAYEDLECAEILGG